MSGLLQTTPKSPRAKILRRRKPSRVFKIHCKWWEHKSANSLQIMLQKLTLKMSPKGNIGLWQPWTFSVRVKIAWQFISTSHNFSFNSQFLHAIYLLESSWSVDCNGAKFHLTWSYLLEKKNRARRHLYPYFQALPCFDPLTSKVVSLDSTSDSYISYTVGKILLWRSKWYINSSYLESQSGINLQFNSTMMQLPTSPEPMTMIPF